MGSGIQKAKSISQKITSLNVFSSALSVEEMKKKTEEGSEICDAKGDYLSWEDMEWETYGKVRLQTLVRENLCRKEQGGKSCSDFVLCTRYHLCAFVMCMNLRVFTKAKIIRKF